MTQLIKNMSQLTKVLEPRITATLELVAEDVKSKIDKYLQEYYDEYDPSERSKRPRRRVQPARAVHTLRRSAPLRAPQPPIGHLHHRRQESPR